MALHSVSEEKKTADPTYHMHGEDTTNNNSNKNDDYNHSVPVMHPLDIDALAERCLKLLKHSEKGDHAVSRCQRFSQFDQVFIGIGGTPGSGKSHIAEAVRDRIIEISPNPNAAKEEAVVIPMDGYHLKRDKLKELAEKGTVFQSDQFGNPDSDKVEGRKLSYDELLARRGAPFTYCPSAFIRDLKAAKETGEGSFPIYSRTKHDPIPDGVQINQHNKIILVEGLYLLCTDDPDWKELDDLWDDKWFVEVSLEETKRRLVDRHLKTWTEAKTKRYGGSGREAATKKAESNDMLNAKCIKKNSKGNASLIICNNDVNEEEYKEGGESKDGDEILKDSGLYA